MVARLSYDSYPKRENLIFFIALAVMIIVFPILLLCNKPQSIHPIQNKVFIQKNQTIWDVATVNYPNADTSLAVDAIRRANDITDCRQVRVGRMIILPEVMD